MLEKRIALAGALIAAVVFTNCGTAGAAAILLQLSKSPAPPPAGIEVFPGVSSPLLFRQRVLTNCTDSCVLKFDAVGTNRLLQIDNITCAGVANAVAYLFRNTQIALDAAHLVAVFQISSNNVGGASGPFYVAAGERPTIAMSSPAPQQAFCSIFGTLWTTGA